MAYVTLAAAKNYLGISESTDDALLEVLISSAQAIIDAATGRKFESAADTTRYLDMSQVDGLRLRLDEDLCSITTITNGGGTVITSAQYKTMPRNKPPYYAIDLLSSTGVSWNYTDNPEAAISIAGRWAYSVTAPADIVQATKRIAAYLYRQKDNALDIDRTILAGNATILPATLPSDVMFMIGPYRSSL